MRRRGHATGESRGFGRETRDHNLATRKSRPMIMRARSILGLSSGLLAGALGRQVSFAEGGGGGARPPPAPPSPSRPAVRLQTQDTMVDLSSERRRPVVICGPSGVGKGTLIARLQAEFPDEFGFSVSHTTRAPRPGEADGVHYHFCSKEAMEAAIGRGARFIRSSSHSATPSSHHPSPRRRIHRARARARQHLRHLRRGGARGGGGGEVLPPRHRRAGAARGVDSHRAKFFHSHTAQFPFIHRAPSSSRSPI